MWFRLLCSRWKGKKITGSHYCLVEYNPPQVKVQSEVNSGLNIEMNVITDLNNTNNKSLLEADYQKLRNSNYFAIN